MKHPTYDIILSHLDRLIKANPNSVIVDAGCGNGYLYSLLESRKFSKYIGFDISEPAINEGKKKYFDRNLFQIGSCTKMPVRSKSADVVISIGVLQYLSESDRQKFLAETIRVLKPGGHLLISCLTDHWAYRLIDLYGVLSPHGVVSRSALLEDLSRNKFRVKRAREYGLIFAPFNSQVLCLLGDVFDYVIFGVRGRIGAVGNLIRKSTNWLDKLDYSIGKDYGYTLIVLASSSGNLSPKSHGRS